MNSINKKVLKRILDENEVIFEDMCDGEEWEEVIKYVVEMYMNESEDEGLRNLCARMWILGALSFDDDSEAGGEFNRLLSDLGMEDGEDEDDE